MNVESTVSMPMTLGPTLRTLREARQVALTDVSERLKFSVGQLQALENEDWAHLPSGLTLRGMVKNYGRFLETDTAVLLSMLDAQAGANATRTARVVNPTSLGTADGTAHHVKYDGWSWLWILLIVVLLVVAGMYAVDRGWIDFSWLVSD